MTLRLLTEYLFQFHRLPLPETGMLVFRRQSARLNMHDKQIHSGTYAVEIKSVEGTYDHLTEWLAAQLNVSAEEAFQSLRHYALKIKAHLNHSDSLLWGHLGVIEKTATGDLRFRGNELQPVGYGSLSAEKAIRSNPEHEVLVGDRTYAGEDLVQLLKNSKKKRIRQWIYFSVISMTLCLLTIVYMLTAHKEMREKHQQQFKINSKVAPDTYIILPSDE